MNRTIASRDLVGNIHVIEVDGKPDFSVSIDSPAHLPMSLGSTRVARISGWAVGDSARSVSARARVGPARGKMKGDWTKVKVNLPRPDVAALFASQGQVVDGCGFLLEVEIPEGSSKVRIEIELSDSEHIMQFEPFAATSEGSAGFQRSEYKSVWNSVSGDYELAKLAVAGYTDEDRFVQMADATVAALLGTVGLKPDDEVLEIGAGVGRVGPAIAPLVKRWVAADVSENMLMHARERCRAFDNIDYVALSGYDLASIPDESLDVVYCTVVFMHLDEWDRFGYIQEAMRVLRPGGRIYVDNVNLCGDGGWDFFMMTRLQYHPLDRPANISKTSTAPELETYLIRAGYSDISVKTGSDWIWAWGTKPI